MYKGECREDEGHGKWWKNRGVGKEGEEEKVNQWMAWSRLPFFSATAVAAFCLSKPMLTRRSMGFMTLGTTVSQKNFTGFLPKKQIHAASFTEFHDSSKLF